MTNIQIKLKLEIYNIDYIDTNDNNYKFTFNKINRSILTTSYKSSDYLCNGCLSIIYEYTSDSKKSLKIKKIIEIKEHSIIREDHTYIIKEEVKESLKTNSTIINKKRCANPNFLKHFLINYCIRKDMATYRLSNCHFDFDRFEFSSFESIIIIRMKFDKFYKKFL